MICVQKENGEMRRGRSIRFERRYGYLSDAVRQEKTTNRKSHQDVGTHKGYLQQQTSIAAAQAKVVQSGRGSRWSWREFGEAEHSSVSRAGIRCSRRSRLQFSRAAEQISRYFWRLLCTRHSRLRKSMAKAGESLGRGDQRPTIRFWRARRRQ